MVREEATCPGPEHAVTNLPPLSLTNMRRLRGSKRTPAGGGSTGWRLSMSSLKPRRSSGGVPYSKPLSPETEPDAARTILLNRAFNEIFPEDASDSEPSCELRTERSAGNNELRTELSAGSGRALRRSGCSATWKAKVERPCIPQSSTSATTTTSIENESIAELQSSYSELTSPRVATAPTTAPTPPSPALTPPALSSLGDVQLILPDSLLADARGATTEDSFDPNGLPITDRVDRLAAAIGSPIRMGRPCRHDLCARPQSKAPVPPFHAAADKKAAMPRAVSESAQVTSKMARNWVLTALVAILLLGALVAAESTTPSWRAIHSDRPHASTGHVLPMSSRALEALVKDHEAVLPRVKRFLPGLLAAGATEYFTSLLSTAPPLAVVPQAVATTTNGGR